MRFYALRIVCQSCGAATLFGGSPSSDLSLWREYSVECDRCGKETSTSDARAVDLCNLAALRAPVDRPVHAA
jgi:hypothetical protein